MISRYITLILTFWLSIVLCNAQDLPPNPEAGKCYAKCYIFGSERQPKTPEKITYPVYIGNDPSVKTKRVKVTVRHPKIGRYEKKTIPNCEHSNPNNCIVWKLGEEAPGIYKTITVAKKTKTSTIQRHPISHISFTCADIGIEIRFDGLARSTMWKSNHT